MKLCTWFLPCLPARTLLPCVLVVAFAFPTFLQAQNGKQTEPSYTKTSFTLNQALEAAWQRSVEATESRSRSAIAQADQAIKKSWLSAAPAFSLGQRDGKAGSPPGSREVELGLSFPLWWPGQRFAGIQANQFQLALSRATEQADRLRLAGRLREVISALHLAESESKQTERLAQDLSQLAQDVDRRVRAGDFAPADAMAARSELLEAQMQAGTARHALAVQQSQWHLLTGIPSLQLQTKAPPDLVQLPESHPELALASAVLELRQRQTELARIQRPDSPELSLGMRQERPGQGTGLQSSVVVALRVPVGGQVYQQPLLAEALAELDIAQTQASRTRERLIAELALAQSQLKLSQDQLKAEKERSLLLAERARLIDKSFRAGESALPDMLRALAAAANAESAFARQQIIYQTAIARVEQALGLLP